MLVDAALATAKSLGASNAVAEVSEGVGLSVSVRKGETENVERNRDKSISITVYVGQRRGNASTSDFSPAAVEQTVRAAHEVAFFGFAGHVGVSVPTPLRRRLASIIVGL